MSKVFLSQNVLMPLRAFVLFGLCGRFGGAYEQFARFNALAGICAFWTKSNSVGLRQSMNLF